MISYLDPLLFPDECNVYELPTGSLVYPIFKNGSSSLRKGARLLSEQELRSADVVDVYVRNPLDRYVSGVQSYLKFMDPAKDKDTVLSMIDEFLFLNRHFSLQFHWLMNFSRHTAAAIHIRNITEISHVTTNKLHVVGVDEQLKTRYANNNRLQFYLLLDKILYEDFMDKTVYFGELVEYIKRQFPELYVETILRSKQLCTVLD